MPNTDRGQLQACRGMTQGREVQLSESHFEIQNWDLKTGGARRSSKHVSGMCPSNFDRNHPGQNQMNECRGPEKADRPINRLCAKILS